MGVDELTCKELVEVVTDYLEGRLSPAEQLRFEEHVAFCSWCATYLQQMRDTIRVNGTLASELTGQPYPLLISIGDMGMDGNRHRWKVLDATSRKAEGFEGVGDTASEAIDAAFTEFGKDAQYGRGIIGIQLPDALMAQLEPGAKKDRRYPSLPAGWAVAAWDG